MAVLDQEKVDKIKKYLRWHSRGTTISDLSSALQMNRNLVAKYLDMLLISGQLEMQVIGAAKVYFLSHRVPISAMLGFSSDYVIVLDTEQQVIQVNEPVLKLINEKREELVGKKIDEIQHPFFRCLPLPEPVKSGQIVENRITEITSVLNGETHHFRVKQVPTAFEDGGQGVTFIIEDITAKKTSEEALKMSEARYRGIVEDQTEFITRFRPDGTLLFVNESYARYLGKKPADLLYGFHIPGIYDEDRMALNTSLESCDPDHPVSTLECRIVDRSGQRCWNHWTIRALFNDKEVVHEYQGVGLDITEKKESAARINTYIKTMEFISRTAKEFMNMREENDIYEFVAQQVYSLAPGFLVWVDILDEPNQRLIFKSVVGSPVARDTILPFTGTGVADISGPVNMAGADLLSHWKFVKTAPLYKLLQIPVPREIRGQVEEVEAGIDTYQMELVSKGRILGSVGICLKRGAELPNRELTEAFIRQAAIAIDRKIAEDALKESEQKYRSVIENIQDGLYRTDCNGNLVMASPSLTHLLGYDSLDQCLGRNIADTFSMDPAKQKEIFESVYRDGEIREYETVLKRKDGTPLYAAVSSHLCRDESGTVTGVEGLFRDISERHIAAEKITNYINQMEFFSRKLQEFIELPPDADIYRAIGAGLDEILPDTIIDINAYDPASKTLGFRAIFGKKGREFYERTRDCNFPWDVALAYESVPEVLASGQLFPFPGRLYYASFHQIPEEDCEKIEQELNLGDFYSIGLFWQGNLLGNIVFILQKGEQIQKVPFIEVYARAASIALGRKRAEEALKESERTRAEEALKNSENYLREIFNSTQSGLVVIDPETHAIFDANSTAVELFGTDKSSLVGSSCKKWFYPAENEQCPVMDLGQTLVRSECVLFNVHGEKKSIIKTVVPVQVDNRPCLLESFVDITDRKKFEEALRESEEMLRLLVDSTPLGVVFSDNHTGTIEYVNPEFEKILGYSLDHHSDLGTWFEKMYPDPLYRKKLYDLWMDDFKRLAGKNTCSDRIFRVRCKDGNEKDIRFRVVHFPNGKALSILEDITERKKAEDALRESEEKYRLVVENSHDAIYIYRESRFIFVNTNASELTGYSHEELMDMEVWDLIHPDDRAPLQASGQRRIKGENLSTFFNARIITKTGDVRQGEFFVDRINYPRQIAILGIVRDVTDRKNVEQKLRENEARLDAILQNSPIPKYVIDTNHRVMFWNKALEEFSGIKAHDVIGTTRQWQSIYEAEQPCLADLMIEGNINSFKGEYKKKITPSRFKNDAIEATDFFPQAGEGGKWLRRTAVAIKDGKGNTLGAVETIEDLTDRHQPDK